MNTITDKGITITGYPGASGAEGVPDAGPSTGAGAIISFGDLPPIVQEQLTAFIASANSDGSGSGDAAESADRAAGAANALGNDAASIEDRLKSLMSLVSDPDMLSKLMIDFANMSRQNALDSRLAAREQAKSDLMAAAGETREAAEKQLTGAIVSMVIAVVVAVVSVVAFVSSVGGAAKSFNQSKEAAQATKIADTAKASGSSAAPKLGEAANVAGATAGQTSNNVQALNGLMQALGGLLNAASQGTSQIFQSQATVDQAEGQEMQALATEEQANADIAKKVVEDLEELVKSAIQFLKAIQDAETDLMATMTRV